MYLVIAVQLRSKTYLEKENLLVSKIYLYLYLSKESSNRLRRCGFHMLEMKLFWKICFHKCEIVISISVLVTHSWCYYSVFWGNPKEKQRQTKNNGRKVANTKKKKRK